MTGFEPRISGFGSKVTGLPSKHTWSNFTKVILSQWLPKVHTYVVILGFQFLIKKICCLPFDVPIVGAELSTSLSIVFGMKICVVILDL